MTTLETRARERTSKQGAEIPSYREVLRCLPGEWRDQILGWFFGDREAWTKRDALLMANAITRMEDWLEINRPRFDRTGLRDVRRRIECGLEP